MLKNVLTIFSYKQKQSQTFAKGIVSRDDNLVLSVGKRRWSLKLYVPSKKLVGRNVWLFSPVYSSIIDQWFEQSFIIHPSSMRTAGGRQQPTRDTRRVKPFAQIQHRGRILGHNWDKSLKSFPPCYSQSPLLTHFTSLPLGKSVLKLVCNVNIVYGNLSRLCPETSTKLYVHEFGFCREDGGLLQMR
jgi:hypothetical protein